MAIGAPKGRKHLSADALFTQIRNGFGTIPDARLSDVEGNLHTIYGIERVPCDTAMRESLDPVSPEALRPVFTSLFRQLQRGKALESMTFLDGHY